MRDQFGNEKNASAVNLSPQPNYTTSAPAPEAPIEAGKILALAGGAAGAIAGLWVLLSEREKQPEPKTTYEQARAIIEEAAAKAKKEGAGTGAVLRANVESLTADMKKQGKKNKKKARKSSRRLSRKAEAEKNEAVERLSQTLKDARVELMKNYGPEVAAIIQGALGEAGHRLEDAKKRSSEYSSQARKDADQARAELAVAAEALKDKAVNAEHQAEALVGAVLVPKVKDLTHEAQAALESGKDRTEQLRRRAEKDVIPEARKRAEELRKKAESDLLPGARKRADELRKRAESDLLPEAKKRAETLTHTVEDQAKVAKQTLGATSAVAAAKLHDAEAQAAEASEAVKQAGRETRSLLLWVALAGVLIFSVFLDEEQQKRLKEIAVEIFGEARDMYADMKGEDSSLKM